jgi:hypothetical protein
MEIEARCGMLDFPVQLSTTSFTNIESIKYVIVFSGWQFSVFTVPQYSASSTTEFKNSWSHTSISPHVFMVK